MLTFKDSKFKILQLSDMQDTFMTSPDTVGLIERLIDEAKPDLIVLTGDQIKGYGAYFKLGGDGKRRCREALEKLLQPIARSGVPFTAVFGNHDEFSGADKAFQWSVYRSCDNFVGVDYEFDCLPVYGDGEIKFCVYTFDSHGKKGGKYSPVTNEQCRRYKSARDTLEAKCSKTVHALAFQHIPPAEIYDCLAVSDKKKKGYFKGAGKFADKYYSMPDYAVNSQSFMGENAASPEECGEQLNAFAEKGDVLGLYFGHDHNNSFVVNYNGIDLGYTQGCGYNVYGPGDKRGGRVFVIDENDVSKYETYTLTARELESFRLKRPVKEFFYTHSPSSVSEALRLIKKCAAVSAAAAAVVAAVKLSKK